MFHHDYSLTRGSSVPADEKVRSPSFLVRALGQLPKGPGLEGLTGEGAW